MGSVCCVPCRSSPPAASDGPNYGVLPLSGPHVDWTVEHGISPLRHSPPASSSSLHHHELHQQQRVTVDPCSSSVHRRNASEGNTGEIAFRGVFHRQQQELHDDNSVSSSGSTPSSVRTSCAIQEDVETLDFSSAGSSSHIAFLTNENSTSGSSSLGSKRKHFARPFEDKKNLSASFNGKRHGRVSAFSKFRSMGFLHKQNSHVLTVGEGSLEDGGWLSESQKPQKNVSNNVRSMSAFSQLMESSQKGLNAYQFEESPLSSEKIQVASPQRLDNSGSQKCSICSRLLIQRSPWSSQRMTLSADLPTVGVLVCGHVFHADCLEKDVPESLKHDPPCPECERHRNQAGKFNRLPVFGTLKAAREPIMSKLSKIAPQMWRAPSRIAREAPSSAQTGEERGMVSPGSFREWGFFHKSMPKKLFSSQTKANKDPVSCSKKFSSSAQVSPASNS